MIGPKVGVPSVLVETFRRALEEAPELTSRDPAQVAAGLRSAAQAARPVLSTGEQATVDRFLDAPDDVWLSMAVRAIAVSKESAGAEPLVQAMSRALGALVAAQLSPAPEAGTDALAFARSLPRNEVAPESLPSGSRLIGSSVFDVKVVKAYLGQDMQPSERHAVVRPAEAASVTPAHWQAYTQRLRSVNNVLWTEICVGLADDLRELRAGSLDDVPRFAAPPATHAYAELDGHWAMVLSDASTTAMLEVVQRGGDFERAARYVHAHDSLTQTAFLTRVPVGEFGEALSRALVEAARIGAAMATGRTTHVKGEGQVLRELSFLNGGETIIQEGFFTIAHALSLLLAKKPAPPHDDLDTLLAQVDASGLVTRLAAEASFGVIGPLVGHGFVPSGPIEHTERSDGKERLQLPRALDRVCGELRDSRREAGPGLRAFHFWDKFERRTETLRGCPVAGRGPVMSPSGEVKLAPQAGLTQLVHEYIELTRKLLREGG